MRKNILVRALSIITSVAMISTSMSTSVVYADENNTTNIVEENIDLDDADKTVEEEHTEEANTEETETEQTQTEVTQPVEEVEKNDNSTEAVVEETTTDSESEVTEDIENTEASDNKESNDVEKTYIIRFIDFDQNVISEQEVKDIDSIIIPENPVRENYEFLNWDVNLADLEKLTEDLVINAVYREITEEKEDLYTVTFLGFEDEEISVQEVSEVKDIEVPEVPEIENYTFVEWDVNLEDIEELTEDMTIRAIYEKNELFKITFLGYEDVELSVQEVSEVSKIEIPEVPEVENYKFVEWDTNLEEIEELTEDLVIKAIYEEINPLVEKTLEQRIEFYNVKASGNMPENAILSVKKVSNTKELETIVEENTDIEDYKIDVAFDIEIKVDGEVWQPVDFDEKVTITIENVAIDGVLKVFRIEDESNNITEMSSSNNGNGVSFETEHFTPYTFGTTGEDCTVIFDTKVDSLVDNQTVEYNSKVTRPSDPTISGLTFGGWYKDSEYRVEWDFDNDVVTENPTYIYAKWNMTYNVYFNDNNGSTITTQTVTEGNLVTKPEDPTKDGYEFAGWYKDNNYTEEWDFDNDVVANNYYIDAERAEIFSRPIYIYAKWNERYKVYFITFVGSEVEYQELSEGDLVTKPADPTNTDSRFGGWYKDYNCTEAWDFDNDVVTENPTYIYAKWLEKHNVNFIDAENYNNVLSTASVYDGDLVTKPANPIKDHYNFIGWYKNDSYTEAWNFNTDTITSDTTIYAKFEAQHYTVSFDTNGGSAVESQSVAYNTNATTPVSPTKEGYTFAGWYKNSSLTTRWYPAWDSNKITEDTTIYAKWTPIYYTVTFDSNGGSAVNSQSVTYNSLVTEPTAPTKDGYAFAGWFKNTELTEAWNFSTDTITSDTTIYAKWSETVYYTVTFDSNGGSYVESQNVEAGEHATKPTDPTKYAAEFVYWSPNNINTYKWEFDQNTVTGNITLYAVWTNWPIITFDSKGGSEVAEQPTKKGSKVTKPADPTKDGFTFDGWFIDESYTEEWNFNSEVALTDTTLYAKWVENAPDTYTVTFNSNGGSSIGEQTVTSGGKAIRPSNPVRTGYNFVGWYSDEALNNEFDFDNTNITSNTVIYAKWSIKTFTVRFNTNGGSTISYQTVDYNSTATRPTVNPIKTHYTFVDWYTNSSLTTLATFNEPITKNTYYYAKWNIESYTVTFNSNGGSTVANQTIEYNQKATEPAEPTKAGFTFGGWFSDESFENEWDFESDSITGNTTLYAKWIEIIPGAYVVTFNVNGGSSIESQIVTEGAKATRPANPTKTGYTFVDFYKDSSLTVPFDFSTETINENTTIYVKWNINTYAVTFNSNGGTAVTGQTINYNQKATRPVNPTKEGYTFGGWFTDTALTHEYDFNTVITAPVTLFAKWVENTTVTYIVTFNSNGGSTVASQTITAGNKAVKPANPTRDGYNFDGWFIDTGFNTKFNFDNDITSNITVIAKWTKKDSPKKNEPKEDEPKEDESEEDEPEEDEPEEDEPTPTPIIPIIPTPVNPIPVIPIPDIPEIEPVPSFPVPEIIDDTEDENEVITTPQITEPVEKEEIIKEVIISNKDDETDEPILGFNNDSFIDRFRNFVGKFVEEHRTMVIVFSLSLGLILAALILLLLLLAYIKRIIVQNNKTQDAESEYDVADISDYVTVLRTNVKSEGNALAQLFKKNDRVWEVIIPEDVYDSRNSNQFRIVLKKLFVKRYNGEQFIVRVDNSQVNQGFIIDEKENVVDFEM